MLSSTGRGNTRVKQIWRLQPHRQRFRHVPNPGDPTSLVLMPIINSRTQSRYVMFFKLGSTGKTDVTPTFGAAHRAAMWGTPETPTQTRRPNNFLADSGVGYRDRRPVPTFAIAEVQSRKHNLSPSPQF